MIWRWIYRNWQWIYLVDGDRLKEWSYRFEWVLVKMKSQKGVVVKWIRIGNTKLKKRGRDIMICWTCPIDDFKIWGDKMNGFTRSWTPSFMCSSSFPYCWDIFVCCRMSWLKIWNSLSRASIDLWAKFDKVMASLWIPSFSDTGFLL